jgi:hypothetical protein
MYKILNKLFGWDYIYWEGRFDSGISKVIVLPDKSVHFKYNGYIVSVTDPGLIVKWLTCIPDKYIK